ncbi:MAG: Fic family protein [Alphaproteobacteria bacterium]
MVKDYYIGTEKALFVAKKMKAELVHNMAIAEGTSLTFIETKTLIDDKVSIAGKNTDDIEQVLRLAHGWDEIILQVQRAIFNLSKENFIRINSLIAIKEALKVGDFRHAQVYIGDYTPPMAQQLEQCFEQMENELSKQEDIFKKASDIFLIAARNQYFYDGNKRTAQLMMNGFLMSHGYAPRSIQQKYLPEYNEKMMEFYHTNNKEDMYAFFAKIANSKRYTI